MGDETAPGLSDKDIEEVFSLFDTDGSGELTAEELLFALKSFSPPNAPMAQLTPADAAQMIETATSRGGAEPKSFIVLQQFKQLIRSNLPSSNSPEEIVAAFRLFDRSGKGVLTKDDVLAAYVMIHGDSSVPQHGAGPQKSGREVESRIAELFRAADTDGDGKITLDEWKNVILKGARC